MSISAASQFGEIKCDTLVGRRDYAIDALKGLAILGVVIHHLPNRRFSTSLNQSLDRLVNIFSWSVFAFLFCAGILSARSKRVSSFSSFITVRSRRLLLPYLVLGIVFAGAIQILQDLRIGIERRSVDDNLIHKVEELVCLRAFYGEQLYFFVLLFVVSLAARLLGVRWSKFHSIALLSLAFVPIIALVRQDGVLRNTGFNIEMFFLGLLQYLLGVCVEQRCRHRHLPFVVMIILAVQAIFFAAKFDASSNVWSALVPLFLYSLLRVIPSRVLVNAGLVGLGATSAAIFAYHSPLIIRLIPPLLLRFDVPQSLCVVTAGVAAVGVGAGLHWFANNTRVGKWLPV